MTLKALIKTNLKLIKRLVDEVMVIEWSIKHGKGSDIILDGLGEVVRSTKW